MTDDGQGIKSMKLYHQVERVLNELAEAGYAPDDPLDVESLTRFDQYHYLGTDAVDEATRRLSITSDTTVIEVGGGIGGPSRHLAHTTSCRVTTIELQPDLNDLAIELTRRCGLAALVTHRHGDALDHVGETRSCDALVSWLTFLHIADRPHLYANCIEALRDHGGLYVEDYYERGRFTAAERRSLANDVFCHRLSTLEEYESELGAAGFADVELIDMTGEWRSFVTERLAAFRASRDRNLQLHGATLVDALDQFYAAVHHLFEGGNLGGVRVVARRGS